MDGQKGSEKMRYRLYAENEKNERIELTDSPYFTVTDVDGLLPETATIKSTATANGDGAKFNSARVQDRPIMITVLPEYPVEENRQRLYRYFRVKKQVTLYYRNQNRNVKISGYVESFDGSLFEQTQTIIITIRCLDPYFKDQQETQVNVSQILDLFEFPFTIDAEGIPFSQIEKNMTQNIINAGDVDTGMIIELSADGEVVDPIIYNADTRERFGLNYTMQAGDVIRINTNQHNKKVELIRSGAVSNLINSIMQGNRWLQIYPGDNTFIYDCTSGDEFMDVTFIYENKYEGV